VPERAAHFRRTLSSAQRAIDAAKADFSDLVAGPGGAKVYGYAEVNRVLGCVDLICPAGDDEGRVKV
jgi:hypothetical protein